MNFKEYYLLREAQSIYYHYTFKLSDILESNVFELSNALLNSGENRFLRDFSFGPYYLSLARNPTSSYKADSILVLDGDLLSQKYKITPLNYWNSRTSDSEMEDRLWSKNVVIPNALKYIKEIHLYMSENHLLSRENPKIPNILKYLEKPIYIYSNRKDLYLLNKKKSLNNVDYSKEDWESLNFKDYNFRNETRSEERDLELLQFLENLSEGKSYPRSFRGMWPMDFIDSIATKLSNISRKKGVLYREINTRLSNLMKKYNTTDLRSFLKIMKDLYFLKS